MKTILFWDKETLLKVRKLIKYAKGNIIPLAQVMDMSKGLAAPVGDTPANSINIGTHKIVYSLEQQQKEIYKHISVSTHPHFPHPHIIQDILRKFGFKNHDFYDANLQPSEDFIIWSEKVGNVTAINVIERDCLGIDFIGNDSYDVLLSY